MSRLYFAAVDEENLIWGIGDSKIDAEADALCFLFSGDEIDAMHGTWPYEIREIDYDFFNLLSEVGRRTRGDYGK